MNVANYYRVSTTLQEERFSLSAQKTELNRYAKNKKWKVINEFVDVETGGKLDKKGLNALLDLVELGVIEAVLVMDQDRLSRLDDTSWVFLKNVLRENGVKIAEPNGTLTDLSNEDHEFMSDLRNLIARREKRVVVKRMMYGKRQRLREGKGWGVCPFEYEYKDGFYYIKKGWEWVIPFIDDLYINKNYGMSLISQELNKVSKTPTGRRWNEHLVSTRLTSKTFHGYQEMTFANGETISSKVYEPMRTEDTYNKIQEIRKRRARENGVYKRASQKNIHLLKYVPITCGYCGRVIYISQHGTSDKPRFNAHHGRQLSIKTNKRCPILINVKRYEYNLIKAVTEILKGKELSEKYIKFDTNDDEIKFMNAQMKKNKKNLSDLKLSKDRLIDLYLDPDTQMEKSVFLEKQKQLDSQMNLFEKEIKKHERKLNAINEKSWNYETLYEYIDIASNIGVELTRHEQARVFEKLFTKGILTEEKLTLVTEIYNGIPIEVNIPIAPNTWTVNKWIREDEKNGSVIYRY